MVVYESPFSSFRETESDVKTIPSVYISIQVRDFAEKREKQSSNVNNQTNITGRKRDFSNLCSINSLQERIDRGRLNKIRLMIYSLITAVAQEALLINKKEGRKPRIERVFGRTIKQLQRAMNPQPAA